MTPTVFSRLARWQLNITSGLFVIGYGIFTIGFFNVPVFLYIHSEISDSPLMGLHIYVTWMSAVYVLTTLMLYLVSLVSVRLLKALCVLLTITNAIALYFMVTYRVIIDRSMIGNILNTNLQESSQFFHPNLIVYILVLGLLPCIVLSKIVIKKSYPLRILAHIGITTIVCLGWIYVSANTWLWIDKNAKQLGGLTLPWSYIVNSARHYNAVAKRNEKRLTLPGAEFLDDDKRIVVLVIGESARSANFGLYGYERDTTPALAALDVIPLKNARSCTTYTTASIECILSPYPINSFGANYETLPSYAHRHGVHTIWRTNNWGEPKMRVDTYQTAKELREICDSISASDADSPKNPTTNNCAYDEVLLTNLEKKIRESNKNKILIVLHQSGSHGPAYYKKYPPQFEAFSPACKSVEPGECSHEALVNAYDNSIRYTDYFLAKVIEMLNHQNGFVSSMIYISDHGESLGEKGFYLHGTPYSIAPDHQKDIPFIVWTSDTFKQEHRVSKREFTPDDSSQLFVFHSILSALNIKSTVLNEDINLFSEQNK